jgi:hypothetical protein
MRIYLQTTFYLTLFIIIMSYDVYPFIIDESLVQHHNIKSGQSTYSQNNSGVVNSKHNVINIIIRHMDNEYIYAEDGSYFKRFSFTKIINNHNPAIKTKIGELFFQNGELVAIIIK